MSVEALTKQVVDILFDHEDKHLQKEIDDIVEQNNKVLGTYNVGFNYRGENFRIQGNRMRAVLPPLAPALYEEMARIHAFRKQLQLDRSLITQILVKVLRPCTDGQDVRDALPECLVALIPSLSSFSRTREAGWTIKDRPMDVRQLSWILPKIETYCAVRLIY